MSIVPRVTSHRTAHAGAPPGAALRRFASCNVNNTDLDASNACALRLAKPPVCRYLGPLSRDSAILADAGDGDGKE